MNTLWHSQDERGWLCALDQYWTFVKPANLELERELGNLDAEAVQNFNMWEWYDFLLNKYFRWKYTAPNRYATTTAHLQKYLEQGSLDELYQIKSRLFSFNRKDIRKGLKIVCQIKGLGPAGGSGLLALLFPEYFGTIDQFAVRALMKIEGLPENSDLRVMKPENLTLSNGVILIDIMRRKARELNRLFEKDSWTPRKIDKILWVYGR